MDSSSVHIKGESSVVRPIKDKIRAYCKQKRVRLVEFFKTFDVHRTKKVSRNQFIRALALALEGLEISTQECDLLASRYQIASEPDMVNYLKFVDQIDKVFVVKNLEKSPQNSVQLHAAGSEKPRVGEDHPSLSAIEKEELKEALATISHIVQTQGVILKMFFQDFDAANNGCVTPEQFRRALGGVAGRLLADRDVALVARAYALTPTAVSYRELHERLAFGRADRTLEQVVAEVQARALAGRWRLADYFQDLDKLRHGLVTEAQFRRALGFHGLRLTEGEVRALVGRYGRASRRGNQAMVSYVQFVAEVEAVFGVQGLERDPTLDVDRTVASVQRTGQTSLDAAAAALAGPPSPGLPGGGGGAGLSRAERELLGETLRGLAALVRTKRLELLPPFADFDPLRRGHVGAAKFERALSRLGLLPGAAACRLLRRQFREHGAAGNAEEVNYRAFAAAVEGLLLRGGPGAGEVPGEEPELPTAAAFRRGVREGGGGPAGGGGGGGGGGMPGGHSIDAMARSMLGLKVEREVAAAEGGADKALAVCLAGLRRELAARAVRLRDFLGAQDRFRSGEVTRARFANALAVAGLRLSAAQLELVSDAFASDKRRDMVDWQAFLKRMEKTEDPHANMAASQSVEEADKLEEILGRIRTTTRQRCLFLRPFFQDYDRNNRWQVTKTQMFAVLDNIGLKLTDEERDILFAAFQVREGVQLTNRMNYKNFVREVDDIEER